MTVPDVTEAELAILRHLWEAPDSTIRQLTDHLYPGGSTSHYATVQKLLERLEAKKCVTRTIPQGAPHRFSAAIGREELMDGRLRELADRFCEGSLTPLLTHLIKSRKLTPGDMAELRALIEQKRPSKSRGKAEG
jgi:predicted transcriptional regulator